MKSLNKLIKANKIWVILSVVVTFVSIGLQLIWTLKIGKLADAIVERTGIPLSFLISMGILLLGNGFLMYVNQIVNRYTSERMAHTLRMNFADAILLQKKSGKNLVGYEAMSKVQNELMQASDYMSNTLFEIIGMFLSGVFALFFLLFQNALLTVIILIPMLIIVPTVNAIGKKLIPLADKAMDKKVSSNKETYSVIKNYESVLVFDAVPFFKERYEKSIEDWAKTEIKKERISAVCNSFTGVLSQVPLIVLFAVGAILIHKGYMTIGTLLIFLNMLNNLLRTLMNLTSWLVSVKNFFVHLKRADIQENTEGALE